jgi:nitroreductase
MAMDDNAVMDINEAIERRHSVRSYTDRPITGEVEKELRDLITECNRKSGLSLQLFLNEPQVLSGIIGRIGFKNVRNYLALIGKNSSALDEKCGYYGEKVVLRATQLGLGSCWVGMGYRKTAPTLATDEKLRLVIALGYAATPGKAHRNKPLKELYAVEKRGDSADDNLPAWFLRGIRAAQLAPTARNQQKFQFTLVGDTVKAKDIGGILSRVDLGIVKYHFEVAAGLENFEWVS